MNQTPMRAEEGRTSRRRATYLTTERSTTVRSTLGTVIRRTMVLSLILGLFLVAAPRANAIPPGTGRESGVTGSVYHRTECAQPGGCLRPGQAMVTAVAQATHPATYRAMTDPDGIFVLWLTPGLYSVSAVTLGAIPQQSKATLVRVDPGFMVNLRIVIPGR